MEKEEQKHPKTDETKTSDSSLMHEFDHKSGFMSTRKFLLILAFALVFGVGTGYLLAQNTSGHSITAKTGAGGSTLGVGAVVGSNDLETFKDTAEGILKAGGIEDEGQFHLVRPGGESQNVYLTSAVVDLAKLKGKKIKVWGATQTAKHAGWLMDVGRVEVLE